MSLGLGGWVGPVWPWLQGVCDLFFLFLHRSSRPCQTLTAEPWGQRGQPGRGGVQLTMQGAELPSA